MKHSASGAAARRFLPALLLAVLPLLGCGDPYEFEPVSTVSGSVFVGGKPAAGAMVTFHPAHDATNPRARRAIATVGADGSFSMTTYRPADGVPPGDYVVTLNWPVEMSPNAHPSDVPPDRLRGRYSSPAKPYTRATVEDKPNVLPPFQIPR